MRNWFSSKFRRISSGVCIFFHLLCWDCILGFTPEHLVSWDCSLCFSPEHLVYPAERGSSKGDNSSHTLIIKVRVEAGTLTA
ncbi:hypothetical protein RchiOBHm_Chr2g0149021 [Rosa chinensis]|uniref:Secreted protein n=1 Tax=Rosa chinensis TaxID=74649 RepID=A0A2P6RZJ7_ROSCH|nr:hypothetical protein RchiOBHm_Chr2g0149021 [Rosa chinensis]